MKLEVGKTYRNRRGEKVGPLRPHAGSCPFSDGTWTYLHDGRWGGGGTTGSDSDLIDEWTDGPVRTVTRKEIVEGVYGRVIVKRSSMTGCVGPWVQIRFERVKDDFQANELRAAAAVLLELAEALE